MKTINDARDKLADHLANMNLDALNMSDLCTYANIVRTIHDANEFDLLQKALSAKTE